MFTGLIEATGEVLERVATASGAQDAAAEFVRALASDAGRKLLASTGID